MLKICCAILIAGFSQTLIAQNAGGIDVRSDAKFRWGLHISPDYTFRTLKISEENQLTDLSHIINSRNGFEKPMVGYHLGGSVGYQIKPFLEIEAGLDFSRRGFRTRKIVGLIFASQLPQNLPMSYRGISNFYYLSLPVNFNFTFGKKQVRFISSFGGSWDYLVQSKYVSKMETEEGKERNETIETKLYSKFNATATIGAGIEVAMKGNAALRIQPKFRYSLRQIIYAPITGYLWNVGLDVGFTKSF